jgi:integrase
MQQRNTAIKRKAKKELKYEKGKNYRIRELASGALQIEIRSKEYGNHTKLLPVGNTFPLAHKHAMKMLRELSNEDLPEEARKALADFTLNQLIDAFIKYKNKKSRNMEFLTSFQTHNTALCSKTLDQHYAIRKGIEDYIETRKKEVEDISINRSLGPLRAMYRNAGKKRLYGLLDDSVSIKTPFDEIDLPNDKDDDDEGIAQWLRPFQELKIFKAVNEEFKDSLQRLKWITLVEVALITCLRRGVLLHLKWGDVKWNERIIKVSKAYWSGGKKAPPEVPITTKLYDRLRRYYDNLPDADKTHEVPIFESINATRYRHRHDNTGEQLKYSTRWADTQWPNIIQRTDLFETKTDKDGHAVYEDGVIVKRWFRFYDLRHTADTRYVSRPYNLEPEEVGYLMGHRGRKKKIQGRYDHSQDDLVDRLRELIDKGDAIVARQLQKPNGDVPEPFNIAFDHYLLKGVQELLKTERDGMIQKNGIEYVRMVEADLERRLSMFPDTEKWLEEKAKADDFNQPRNDYKRKYNMYPEDDIVMQTWFNSNGQIGYGGDDERARAYLICERTQRRYNDNKELRHQYGIEDKEQSSSALRRSKASGE